MAILRTHKSNAEEIHQFCEDEYKDITPKSQKRIPVDNSAMNPPSKRLCSHCRKPGHTTVNRENFVLKNIRDEIFRVKLIS